MGKRTPGRKAASALILALALGFIWGNSILPGRTSGQVSGGLLQAVARVLGDWLLQDGFHLLLRKLGHFTEFCLLAAAARWFFFQWRRPGAELFPACLLLGLMAAAGDEFIQQFIPGRGSSVTDVWIDFFGFSCGTALCTLLCRSKKSE